MEPTFNLLSFFIIVGTFLGFTLGCILLFIKARRNSSNLLLGALVFVFTLFLTPGFLFCFGLLHHVPQLTLAHVFSGFLIGPLTYLYVSACTEKDFSMRPARWAHFLPFLLDLLYNLPRYADTAGVRYQQFVSSIAGAGDPPFETMVVFKALHASIYYIFSVLLVRRYKKHIISSTSYIDNVYHRWLLFFCSVLLLPIVVVLVFVLSGFQVASVSYVMFGFFFFIFAIYLSALLKPEIFHTFPNPIPINDDQQRKKQKYENSSLKEAQKERFVNNLIRFMETERPYLQPELTLAQLADNLKIPAHYLSQIINEKLGHNFLDFINGYRVKDAKTKLANPHFNHMTILAIAYEVGFNSKTAFYSAFKKQTGHTPTHFRKSMTFQEKQAV